VILASRERFEPVVNKVTIVADYLRHSRLAGYSLAFGLSSGAFLIEWIFDSVLRTAPFLSFFPAIALSALLGGWRPGLFSAVILALLGWYFVIPPKYSFALTTLQDGVLLFFYCFASGLTLLIVILLDRMRSQASAAHHRAEIIAAELAKREAELKISQDRLRAATDAAALGIFEWQIKADAARWENSGMYKIFGIDKFETPVNLSVFKKEYVHPDDAAGFEANFAQAAKARRLLHTVCRIRRRPDGAERWIEIQGRYDYNCAGEAERLNGVIRDISGEDISQSGLLAMKRRAYELSLATGNGIEVPLADRSRSTASMGLCIQRAAVAPFVRDIEQEAIRLIPRESEALRFLLKYATIMREDSDQMTPEMLHLAVTHINELIAMALGTARDVAPVAKGRGARAARLRAIKADVLENLAHAGLTLNEVALRHGITPRYIHMLFESEGVTFSEYVRDQRLTRAHHVLLDPRSGGLPIAAIAYAAGFGDLSYFNRCFRRRFGATPSEVRSGVGRSAREERA
jgi:AraC-like DNA-binding protein/PAS domain-containing protein